MRKLSLVTMVVAIGLVGLMGSVSWKGVPIQVPMSISTVAVQSTPADVAAVASTTGRTAIVLPIPTLAGPPAAQADGLCDILGVMGLPVSCTLACNRGFNLYDTSMCLWDIATNYD